MLNGAEGPAMEQPDDQGPSTSATPPSVPSAPSMSAAPAAPAPMAPAYRPPVDCGIPKLGRGIVWSELVREMEREHAARLARAADGSTPLRPGRIGSGAPDEGIEEAA